MSRARSGLAAPRRGRDALARLPCQAKAEAATIAFGTVKRSPQTMTGGDLIFLSRTYLAAPSADALSAR
jgi:hypothetical protein